MSKTLDGARLKLARAEEHLDTLKAEIRSYLETRPYECDTRTEGAVITAPRPTVIDPPPRLGTIVGDCVYNLMASLDYVIWELANRYAGRALVPPPDGTDKPSFPLFADETRFAKNTCHFRRRYKIPEAAVDVIKQVQPFNAGYEPLFLLYQLVNQDKHRMPLLALAKLDEAAGWGLQYSLVRQGVKGDKQVVSLGC